MNMADRIQHLRKSKGISQEELADKVGVSRQAVSKWESEQSTPDIEKVILLSNFFDVTTDYLLKGIEPITENGTERSDARIFSLVGSVFDFIGLVVAIMIWDKEQTSSSVAVGLILMAVGITVFAYRVCVFSVVSFSSAKNRSTFFCARTSSCISFRALR
jgi:transcriptional regulator with XRE-family HTH domain